MNDERESERDIFCYKTSIPLIAFKFGVAEVQYILVYINTCMHVNEKKLDALIGALYKASE